MISSLSNSQINRLSTPEHFYDSERADRYWLIFGKGDGEARLDVRALDRILSDEDSLVLHVGETVAVLPVMGGSDYASALVAQLSAYTRSAPIANRDVYQDARRRLDLAERGRTENGSLLLFVNGRDVFCEQDWIYYGNARACRMDLLGSCLEMKRALPLARGVAVDATLVLLTLAVTQRREDTTALAERVKEYEASSRG